VLASHRSHSKHPPPSVRSSPLGALAAEAEDDVKDREAGISVLKRMTRNWHPVADSMIPSAYVYTGLSKTPRDSNLEHLINIRLFHLCPLHPLPLPSSIIFNLNIRLCVRFTCAQATPSGRDTCQVDPGCNLLGLAAKTCPKDTEGTVT
jgi:hypothetical protein